MNKKKHGVLILGCGGHARFIISILKNINFEISGLIDVNDNYDLEEVIMNVPIIGSINCLPKFLKDGYNDIVLAVGDNKRRKTFYEEVINLGFNLPNIIHTTALIDDTVLKGDGNVFGPSVIIGAEVKIGSNNIFNSACMVEHQSIIGSHNHLSLSSIICGSVKIGNEVFIGANSTVIDKKHIANNTTIGSNTNLVSNVNNEKTTLVGNPGKIVSK